MSQHDGLVDLRLAKPGNFLGCEEYLNGNVLVAPFSFPHLAVPAFANTSNQRYLLRYCSLNLAVNKKHIVYY